MKNNTDNSIKDDSFNTFCSLLTDFLQDNNDEKCSKCMHKDKNIVMHCPVCNRELKLISLIGTCLITSCPVCGKSASTYYAPCKSEEQNKKTGTNDISVLEYKEDGERKSVYADCPYIK